MSDLVKLKLNLECEQKILKFLIEEGSSENRNLRERILENNKLELEIVKKELYNSCFHEWESDYIEVNINSMKKIIVCKKCGLNKI